MFCKKCGAHIPDGSVICPNCGQAVAVASNESTHESVSLTWKNYVVLAIAILSLLSVPLAFIPGYSDALGEHFGVGANELALLDGILGVLLLIGWNNPHKFYLKWIVAITICSVLLSLPFVINNMFALLLTIAQGLIQVLVPYSIKKDMGLNPWK